MHGITSNRVENVVCNGPSGLSPIVHLNKFVSQSQELNSDEKVGVLALHKAFQLFSTWNADHNIRVGILVTAVAKALGHSRHVSELHGIAASLHDIGKLKISLELLDAPRKLTEEERSIMQDHVDIPLDTFDFIAPHRRDLFLCSALHHHENYDGSGYPCGLHGTDITEIGQIARIADFYDALACVRPYRGVLSEAEIWKILYSASGQFNPTLFNTFQEVLECSPALREYRALRLHSI